MNLAKLLVSKKQDSPTDIDHSKRIAKFSGLYFCKNTIIA